MATRRRVGTTVNVEADFSRGFIRDVPRHAIPAGGCYDVADMFVHEPGRLYKRGGWSYAGPVTSHANSMQVCAYADFPTGGQLLGVGGDDGRLYKVTSGTTTNLGPMVVGGYGQGTPKLWLGGGRTLLVIPNTYGQAGRPLWKYDGSAAPSVFGAATTVNGAQTLPTATLTVASTASFPSSGVIWVTTATTGSKAQQVTYTGKTATTFTGCTGGSLAVTTSDPVTSTPPGAFLAIYKTRLAVGGVPGYENRTFFSPTPDIENASGTTGWDTANVWVDSDYAITGYAPLSTALLVFNNSHMERLVGSTPPGQVGADMDRSVVSGTGCTDERSIVIWNDNAIWANPTGVFISNGGKPESLTQKGGIATYWRSLLADNGYDPSSIRLAAGLHKSLYFITASTTAGDIATLVCHLPTQAWTRLNNLPVSMYASSSGVAEELYASFTSEDRIAKLSGMFAPTSANKVDEKALTTFPHATMTTRALGRGPTLKHFGLCHLTYDMRDSASDNPDLIVGVAPGLEATTTSASSGGTVLETTDATRARLTIGQVSQAISLVLVQEGKSSKTEIFSIEYEERPLAPVEGGQ